MVVIDSKDCKTIHLISELANANPFSIRRFELESKVLGRAFSPEPSAAWSRRVAADEPPNDRPNVSLISAKVELVVENVIAASASGGSLPTELHQPYWDVATYLLLYRHITPIPYRELWGTSKRKKSMVAKAWRSFFQDYVRLLDVGGPFPLDAKSAAHLFACLAQVHRAFFHIFDFILGESLPVTRLRERVWESIFSSRLDRYHQGLFGRMRDLSTLITGPSGTGKELVARAIGLSQYIPFDSDTEQFVGNDEQTFYPLNLSALSPTLIESELFGHHRGAFTGAVEARIGWLESCSPHGAVFLDEIGELDVALQVKLLRVVQQRTYTRLGENELRQFQGKIISATNRDLAEEVSAGRFREDFYFRLCSDRIQTPGLREQLDDRPSDLHWLVRSIASSLVNGPGAEQLADEATEWIENQLGTKYPWAGNIRELEQCVSSIMLRGTYQPLAIDPHRNSHHDLSNRSWLTPIEQCQVTAEDLLRRYCTKVYFDLGSYEKTADQLKIDRRTVKAKIDWDLLEQLKQR